MPAAERITMQAPWRFGVLALACVGTGILSGYNPEYGLFAAVGVTFTVIVLMDVTLGFVVFTTLSFVDVLNGTGSASITKAIGLVLFASWLARLATLRGADLAAFLSQNKGLVIAMIAMLGWSALSFAWAFTPSTALGGSGRYLLDMLLVPIAFGAVREREHVMWVLAAFVIGALISSLYGFVHPLSTTQAGRATGTIGDANAEGTVLAAAIPLLLAIVAFVGASARMKLAATIGVTIMFVGLMGTLSREGLLSLGAVMVCAVVFGGRWRAKAATLLAIGVVATVGYFFVLAPLTARQRVTATDTSGRSSIWTVAWRMIENHPVLGVGTDNFILVEYQYIDQPGVITSANYIVDTPKVAHNAFLEALADLGIPGLLTLLAVLGCALTAAVRAAWMFERSGDRGMEAMSRAIVLALVAVLTSDLFASSEYAKFLWILLALCPVVLALARRGSATAAAAARGPTDIDAAGPAVRRRRVTRTDPIEIRSRRAVAARAPRT